MSSPAELAFLAWGGVVQPAFVLPSVIPTADASVVPPRLKSMHKSIELGRAVLSTSTSDLELWLKTLITISPQQECTNFDQHNVGSLLELLSSGEVWVGRGNGLYIELELTLRGQPPANEQLRQLSEVILGATVSASGFIPTLTADSILTGLGSIEIVAIVAR